MNKYSRKLIVDSSVRELCPRPYPNHPKGCPNYRKRPSCPPHGPELADVFDLYPGFLVVYVSMDFAAHRRKMKTKHPNWSQRQIDCCLYWQGGLNKKLREEVFSLLKTARLPRIHKVAFCPEAMGVNVTATMKNLGVELEWPPENIVYKVAIIGIKKPLETSPKSDIIR